LGGGPLFEASHCIDFVRYVLGEPEFVFGIGGRYKPNKISAVDTYAASFIYPSGDRALICDSYALKNFGWDQEACRLHRVEIDIAGPGGYIQYPDKDQSWQLTICTYGEPQDRIEKTSWTSIWGANGYRSELEHFIDCVRHKKTPSADGYEGLRTVRLCETILHSIETGQVCKFDALTSNNALAGGRG